MTEGARHRHPNEVDPLIGRTISGRYRIHRLVGQGGMGKVYEAQQIPLGRSVAVKVLDAHHVEREFQRRFLQEAAILARLKSRHTVTIYDYGRDGDQYFIAMEFVPGPSLDRLVATEGPLEVARAVTIAEHICRSLREAHAQGIIHRDLKPANVMLTVTEDGEELAKVLDFGLAKRTDRDSQAETQHYVVPGSPKYMAPEAIHQQPIDGRVDIYALGVMLYYMLAGAVPFDRENPLDILRAHLHETPRPLRVTNPNVQVPDALERIVMRCIAKAPADRFATMQDLLEVLRAFSHSMQRPSGPRWAPPPSTYPAPSTYSDAAPALRGRATVPPAASGPTASARPSAAPLRLGLDRRDVRTPSVSFAPDARHARRLWLGAALTAIAITGFAVWQSASGDGASHAMPVPVQAPVATAPAPAPVPAPAPAPAPASSAGMVITPEEAEAAHSIALHVTTDPAGAGVFVNGKRLGFAPGDFEWTPDRATPKRRLIVQLRRTGYIPQTSRYSIDVPRIDLDAKLEPLAPEPEPVVAPDSTASDEPEAESADPPAPEP